MASALALLVPRIFANHAHHIFTLHNFAGFTKPFYRCSNFHVWFPVSGDKKSRWKCSLRLQCDFNFLPLPERYPSLGQVVRGYFYHNFAAWQDANEVQTHFFWQAREKAVAARPPTPEHGAG